MRFRSEKKNEGDFNLEMTPLIDIVFLLLIFFMVSTTFNSSPGISVDLPASSTSKMMKKSKDLMVTISKGGQVTVEDQAVEMGDLESFFTDRSGESTRVVIRADRYVEYGTVVKVMDLAQKAGLAKVAIATNPESMRN